MSPPAPTGPTSFTPEATGTARPTGTRSVRKFSASTRRRDRRSRGRWTSWAWVWYPGVRPFLRHAGGGPDGKQPRGACERQRDGGGVLAPDDAGHPGTHAGEMAADRLGPDPGRAAGRDAGPAICRQRYGSPGRSAARTGRRFCPAVDGGAGNGMGGKNWRMAWRTAAAPGTPWRWKPARAAAPCSDPGPGAGYDVLLRIRYQDGAEYPEELLSLTARTEETLPAGSFGAGGYRSRPHLRKTSTTKTRIPSLPCRKAGSRMAGTKAATCTTCRGATGATVFPGHLLPFLHGAGGPAGCPVL